MLRAVGVSDAILGAGQLFLNISTAFFRLLTSRFRLDDVGELDDQIELSGAALFVDGVQNVQLPDQPLHGGVGLVHDCEERVLHQGHCALGQDDVLLFTPLLVIDPQLYVLWIPFQDLADPQLLDFVGAVFRVDIGVRGHDGHAALVQHGHDHVLDKGPSGLVQIRLQGQAGIQRGVDHLGKPPVLIQPRVLDGDGGRVQRDPVVDRCDDGPLIAPAENGPVRTVGGAWAKRVSEPKGFVTQKSVPGMFQPGTKCNFHNLSPPVRA